MAFDNTKLSYFHSFSKMPAQNSTSLGNAINKSGHTVTASEVWSQDIPYYGKMGSLADVITKVQPYARKNDMCYITAGDDKGKTFQYDGEGNWTDITATLVDGALIKNANDVVVLLYHKGQTLTNLTADNNANTDSADNAARLWAKRAKDGSQLPVGETRLIEQFVAPTDKALNGLASVAYAPVIANGSLVSGTGYYDYCFSGTILWATARTASTLIDCFEYVGDKIDSSLSAHQDKLIELDDKFSKISVIASGGIQDVTENAKTAGFSVTTETKTDEDGNEITTPLLDIDKATVTDGVIDTTTGNGDKVISATGAKAVAEKAIETALADTTKGSLGATIASKVADVTVDDSSIVGADKVAKLTTTGTAEIAANAESTSTKLATEASVAKTAQTLTTAIDAITGVGVSYEVLGDNEKHESVTAPVKGRIYLEKDETAADGTYIEWFYTGTSWEKIGSTKADHSVYAKNITINGETKTVSNNAVDLGKAVTSVTAGGGITNGTVSNSGALSLTLDEAFTYQKGIVQLASTHDANDTTKAATGATVAAAISDITEANKSDNGVKVTTKGGSVTGVEVNTTSLVSEDALVESVTGDNLITAADALEAIKLAKPENYVASVTGYNEKGAEVTTTQGATVKVLDGRGTNVTADDLWGTTATMDASGVLTVSHNKLSNPNASKTSAWVRGITKVEGNKAYNGDNVVANIQTEMIKDGSYMFYGTNLSEFTSDLSSLTNGYNMFDSCYNLSSFTSDLSSLRDGEKMFGGCTTLSSFSSDLSSLTNGSSMFGGCINLESFTSDLSSLRNGGHMFYGTNLSEFTSDLSSLTDGSTMFGGCVNDNFTSFTSDLSSLTNGYNMFYACINLASFCGDLSSLTNGTTMFGNCRNLTSFTSDLSSLTNAEGMFGDTKLDAESVECIADVIKSWGVYGEDGSLTGTSDEETHYITIDVADTASTDIAKYLEEIAQKGWTVATNHTAFAATSAIDGDKPAATFMIAHPATEDNATYVDAAGNFFTIETAVSVIGIGQSEWSIFASIEDAIAEWGLTPYAKA